jgi:hypothetical protein
MGKKGAMDLTMMRRFLFFIVIVDFVEEGRVGERASEREKDKRAGESR